MQFRIKNAPQSDRDFMFYVRGPKGVKCGGVTWTLKGWQALSADKVKLGSPKDTKLLAARVVAKDFKRSIA